MLMECSTSKTLSNQLFDITLNFSFLKLKKFIKMTDKKGGSALLGPLVADLNNSENGPLNGQNEEKACQKSLPPKKFLFFID